MTRVMNATIALAFALCAAQAYAEDTVGSILDGGGKKLSADEFNAELGGKSVSGTWQGGTFRHDFMEGGKLGGSLTGTMGTGAINGTWKAADTGQVCIDYTIGIRKRPGGSCAYYFKAGDQYFSSKSDADKAAHALPLKINK